MKLVVLIDRWNYYQAAYMTEITARGLAILFKTWVDSDSTLTFAAYATEATGLPCEEANEDLGVV